MLHAADAAAVLAYDGTPDGSSQKRLLQHTRTRYWSDELTGPLPFGEVEGRALVYESFAKVLTPSLITSVFGTRVTGGVLAEGGYLQLPDDPDYWVSSGRAVPSAAHFYLPTTFVDPFGNTSHVVYDAHCLLVTQATDPLSNVVVKNVRLDGIEQDLRLIVASSPSYGVEVQGDSLVCRVPCGFATQEGNYIFTVSAEGYPPQERGYEGKYRLFKGGCPSYNEGGVRIALRLSR